MYHDACLVSTGGDAFEPGFKISECKERCSNDAACKGYSTETANMATETSTIRIDNCYLYTTSNATKFCSFNRLKDTNSPPSSVEQIDVKAKCEDPRALLPGVTMEYHEGCHIKIKVKTDDVNRGNKTDTSFVSIS